MNFGLFKMTMPLFSIIIPTFNSAKTLDACLSSIISQSLQNFEVLIFDGLSTDATLTIVKQFAGLYPNIRWVSEKDQGIYDAMNKGIGLCSGEWLLFLGSDDTLYDREVLGKIATVINGKKIVDVVYGNVFSTRFNGFYDGVFTPEKLLRQNICHQSVFFKKSIFNSTGTFDLKYRSHADWDHNFRWFFSKEITNKYVDIIIADYGDGGFSSTNPDHLFYQDKYLKYIYYGHRSLTFKQKSAILKSQFLESVKYRDYKKMLAVMLHVPYIFF
jgi:glycosyltransferase involved in cell wall biosynthesis